MYLRCICCLFTMGHCSRTVSVLPSAFFCLRGADIRCKVSKPFPSVHPHPHQQPHSLSDPSPGDKFPSPLFLNFAQAVASSLSALCYLSFKAWREGWKGRGLGHLLGLKEVFGKSQVVMNGDAKANKEASESDEKTEIAKEAPKQPKKSLLALLVQVSIFQTIAGPIGFLALRHISYPTMVLGKVSAPILF